MGSGVPRQIWLVVLWLLVDEVGCLTVEVVMEMVMEDIDDD